MTEPTETPEPQRYAAVTMPEVRLAPVDTGVFTHSDSIAKLAGALAAAQFKYAPLKATSTADAEKYTYRYADLASVLEAIRPALSGQGIAIIQGVAMLRASTGSSGMVVSVETRLVHSSGEWISTTLKLPTPESAPQKVGALVSYLRRYGLLALAGVASEDPDAADQGSAPPRRPAPPQRPPAAPQAPPRPVTPPAPTDAEVRQQAAREKLGETELPPAKPKPAPKATKPAPAETKPASAETPKPTSAFASASERGLLFKVAREQSLTERQVKALIFQLFGYTSTTQIRQGAELHKVINTMENPADHGVTFAEDDAVYRREDDVNALPESVQ